MRRKKSKCCPDPNETGFKFTNHEFPDIVAIKLDLVTKEKEARREIVVTVQTIRVLS